MWIMDVWSHSRRLGVVKKRRGKREKKKEGKKQEGKKPKKKPKKNWPESWVGHGPPGPPC